VNAWIAQQSGSCDLCVSAVTSATVEKAVLRVSGADVTPATVRRGHMIYVYCSSVDVCPLAI
jgi:hypothetical protein